MVALRMASSARPAPMVAARPAPRRVAARVPLHVVVRFLRGGRVLFLRGRVWETPLERFVAPSAPPAPGRAGQPAASHPLHSCWRPVSPWLCGWPRAGETRARPALPPPGAGPAFLIRPSAPIRPRARARASQVKKKTVVSHHTLPSPPPPHTHTHLPSPRPPRAVRRAARSLTAPSTASSPPTPTSR